jgi:hypothetical protein
VRNDFFFYSFFQQFSDFIDFIYYFASKMEHVAVDAGQTHEARPKMIFVSGGRASVGKSTVALGLLGSLLRSVRRIPPPKATHLRRCCRTTHVSFLGWLWCKGLVQT